MQHKILCRQSYAGAAQALAAPAQALAAPGAAQKHTQRCSIGLCRQTHPGAAQHLIEAIKEGQDGG